MAANSMVYSLSCTNFQESRNHLEILATRTMTWNKIRTEDPQIFGVTLRRHDDLAGRICASFPYFCCFWKYLRRIRAAIYLWTTDKVIWSPWRDQARVLWDHIREKCSYTCCVFFVAVRCASRSYEWEMFIQLLGVLLGAFAESRKAAIRLVISACLSVPSFARKNLALTGRISMKFYVEDFPKICRKIQVSLKSDKNDGYFRSVFLNLCETATR